jgi:serine protease Do
VVINKMSGYVVTCEHCVRDNVAITVNGRHGKVANDNRLLDIAVIRTELKDAENMPLAAKAPLTGDEVAILGYAWGAKRLAMQFGRVSLPLDDDGALVIDAMTIGGNSGGPAINAAGELVGLTSAVKYNGPMHVGIMVPVEKVRAFVEQYLPQEIK